MQAESVTVCKALASDCRLQILRQLTEAKPLRDILVFTDDDPERPPRPLARQSVQKHVDRLLEAGLLRAFGEPRHFVVDGGKLYGAIEDLRGLAALAGAAPIHEGEARALAPPAVRPDPPDGPHLTLVHGVPEGRSLPLTEDGGPWTLGRGRQACLRLGCDPYVSAAHARIHREGGRYVLESLPARNVVTCNWTPLEPGQTRTLQPGDVIGLGRTLLVFRDAPARRPAIRPARAVAAQG